jgi:hypothetical protein
MLLLINAMSIEGSVAGGLEGRRTRIGSSDAADITRLAEAERARGARSARA